MTARVTRRSRFLALAPMAAAAVVALAAPLSAQALQFQVTSMLATGNYAMNGGSTVDVAPWQDTATSKDVLEFSYAAPSSVGLHSYGNTSGYFGSRSSGTGVYDVTGSFSITVQVKNNGLAAEHASFDFYITPGYLNLLPFAYAGSQFAEAGVGFFINTSDNRASFASQASVRADTGGVSFTQTGENIYGGSDISRTVEGGSHSLDLGVINAGEQFSLTYKLSSYAKGDAVSGTTHTVPAWDEVIPAHWIEYQDCGYGYGGGGYGELNRMVAAASPYGECTTVKEFVAEQVYHHDEFTQFEGQAGGSQGSSGDPFGFSNLPVLPPGVALTALSTNVPEPGALSLVALALAGLGWSSRRRRG